MIGGLIAGGLLGMLIGHGFGGGFGFLGMLLQVVLIFLAIASPCDFSQASNKLHAATASDRMRHTI